MNVSRYLKNSISIISKSVIASIIAGTTMAVLNVLIEFLRGEYPFGFQQIYQISLWHILIWLIFGVILGVIFSIIFILKKVYVFNNLTLLIYFYIYTACWVIIVGYINIHLLGKFFSTNVILWNLLFIIVGLLILIIVLRKISFSEIKKFPIPLKLYLFVLIIIIFSSIFLNVNLFFGKSRTQILDKDKKGTHFNVIMIILDAVRADHLSCYGYSKKTSPNIDRIARNGVLFENAFATSSHTAESVPSLLGSIYPSTHNVRLGWMGSHTTSIPKNLLLLPSIFKKSGYKTAFFSVGAPVSSIFGYDRDVDDYYEPQKIILRETIFGHLLNKIFRKDYLRTLLRSSYSLIGSKYNLKLTTPEYVTQKVISWLSANQNNPFFLYMHLFGGHQNYDPPAEHRSFFDSEGFAKPVTTHPERIASMFPFVKQPSLSERELNNMIALYNAEIFYHDKYVGYLLNYLEEANLSNNTIVIFTSDHGEEFYDHYGWGHIYSLFDELIHIPLIIYCPALIPKGKRIDELFAHVDILPTLLSLCGISDTFKPFYNIEGIDLSSLVLSGNHVKTREFIFSEVNILENLSASCLRTKKFKAIQVRSEQDIEKMFFDLKNDPFEKNNIYNEGNPNINEVFKRLGAIQRDAIKKSFKADKIELDEKTKEQLKALGYIK